MRMCRTKQLAHRTAAAALSLTLALGGLPLQALAGQGGDQSAQAAIEDEVQTAVLPSDMDAAAWTERVDEMLAKDAYVEGEAVVSVSGDLGTAVLGDDVEAVLVMQMTGKDFEQATGTILPARALEGADERIGDEADIVTSADVSVKVLLLRSDGLSTRELLLMAQSSEVVLDITPNYAMDSVDPDQVGTDGSNEQEGLESTEAGGDGNGIYGTFADGASAADGADSREDDALLSTDAATAGSYVPSAPTDTTASADLTSYQWAYNKDAQGFKGLLAEAAGIDLEGWNTGKQNSSGVIAVFDSGIDYTHPDLAGAFFDMTPYLSRTGGTSHGFDALVTGADARTNTNEPKDLTGHGTHVAGIIAAQANDFGVSGYASGAKLLAVRVANSSSTITKAAFLSGLDYVARAIDAGVDIRVINNSWELYPYSNDSQITSAIQMMGSTYGVTFVFASGNRGTDIDALKPATEDLTPKQYVLTVDSSDLTGACSAFSSYGAGRTDLFAPGSAIMSTLNTSGSKSRGVFVATASNSYGFETFSGAPHRGVTTDRGAELAASVDSSTGFDSTGGCLSLPSESVKAAAVNDASSAKTRVVLCVPVDESRLDDMSTVGCAVSLSGYPYCKAWLEVMAVYNSQTLWAGDVNSRREVDNGNWAALSLDMSRVCTSSNKYQVKLFYDEDGQAYIKVAVCLNKSDYAGFNKLTVGLRIDSIGVGDTCWNYGFMSGTSMAAPLVSGMASSYAYQMGDAYASLAAGARAQKLVNVVKKSVTLREALDGRCSTGGAVDPTKFSVAAANDEGTVYIASASEEEIDDKTCLISIEGSGFGDEAGTVTLASEEGETGVEVVSWTDSEIQLKARRVYGHNVVTATVASSTGDSATSLPISELDTAKDGGAQESVSATGTNEGGSGQVSQAKAGMGGDVPKTGDEGFDAAFIVGAFVGGSVLAVVGARALKDRNGVS